MSTRSATPASSARRRGQLGLRCGEGDPQDLAPWLAAAWIGEAPPAAADVEHPFTGREPQLRADQLQLGLLGLSSVSAPREKARSCRSSTGPGTTRRTRRQVVVMAHRARVARAAVTAAPRAQLRRRAARRPRAGRTARAAASAGAHCAAVERAVAASCRASRGRRRDHRRRARRTRRRGRRRAARERAAAWAMAPGSARGRSARCRWSRPAPCRPRRTTQNGRSGSARQLVTSGAVRANGTRGGTAKRLRRLARRRSGSIRTTSQASPADSSARITSAEESISYLRSPCAAEVGKAWWLLCQDSPKVEQRQPRPGCATHPRWRSRGGRRSGRGS